MKKLKFFFKNYQLEILVFIFSFIFSWWLMFSTFSYKDGGMLIGSKAWSDFANHIPLIRSFSLGNNFAPQYPLFSGPPIKYHFAFYAFAGFLEGKGLRIDYALNIVSVLGLSLLILMIFVFSKLLFKKNSIAILSIVFFIFNGSLSFIKFILEHIQSKNIFLDIVNSKQFTSFGPYNPDIISAFWNLNIYTNQRHLSLSYALSLIMLYRILKSILENKKENLKINLLIGIILGLTFFINIAVFLMTEVVFSILFVLFKNYRKGLLISIIAGGIVALPQYIFTLGGNSFSGISVHIGYLAGELNILNLVNYWFQNLGLHLILIPLGFILAPKKIKKVLVSFFIIFLIANLFKFSPEVAANHKFFNYFMITGVIFSAYIVDYLWKKKNYFKPIAIICTFFLVFSGIIDFFPIFNDSKIVLADFPKNKDIEWIIKNTNKDSVFLNTTYLYDNASMAGRKILLGWPYFAWSQGYDTYTRDGLRKNLLVSSDLDFFCKKSIANKIDYIELNLHSQDAMVNKMFFDKNFPLIYKNAQTEYYIYKINNICL